MIGRLLVVDDDRSMVRTLSDILTLEGWEVSPAYSGEMAVRATREDRFDVVLMDVKMPGIDGVDALKEIRQSHPDIRVILMTAYSAPERIAEAERAGAVRVLSKPVNVAELFQLLAGGIDRECSVLVIDDDEVFLRTLSDVLQMRGYRVASVQDIPNATRLIADQRPCAILLHLRVGEVSLLDTLASVRDASDGAALVLYSGRPGAAEEVEERVPRGLVYAYLQKPFAVTEVTSVLERIRHGR